MYDASVCFHQLCRIIYVFITIIISTARLFTNTGIFDHITPVLRDLHWLPVRQPVVFKTAMPVYKCLRGLVPSYLREFCRPVSSLTLPGRWQLRSGTTGILHVPRTQTSIGCLRFVVAGPVTWNSFCLLPSVWRHISSAVIDYSLQRIVVGSFLIFAVYKCPHYYYYYYYYYY